MKGFHKASREDRLRRVQEICGLSDSELEILSGKKTLSPDIAEHLIENVIGWFPLPLGVATYFKIDGKEVLIPLAVEETSIVAALSASAKWILEQGSIRTYNRGRLIIGQVQIPSVQNIEKAISQLGARRNELIEMANACIPGLVARGGGVRDIAIRELDQPTNEAGSTNKMLVLHVLCDPCDAMGANLINQVCEALKPKIEEISEERVGLCILSNLVDGRMAGAEVVIRNIDPKIGRGIEEAYLFAQVDPYRAATHNKGTLNGIDPVLIATGNDWRAVEAGVHAYASRNGRYEPITEWKMVGSDLVGKIEIPLSLGTVGGVTQAHPFAKIALKMMKVESADDLARICAATGLVQNLGALKALATVGIVQGHMNLHTANLAIAAGAAAHEIGFVREELSQILKKEKRINLSHAREILKSLRADASSL
tara:strand:+ start:188 stop:1468 length:1281 start_codon:yes stop_codon:yes gene_type:complete